MASKQITAIDIGTNSVKVAQFEKEDTEVSLVNLGIADYPRADATEEIKDEVITNTLKNILEKNKIKTKSVVLSIPRELVTSRKMTDFPLTATDEQVKGMVETQAEAELPFGTEETVFDHYNLRRTEDQISVDLVAARRASVDKYVSILEQLGIEPVAILPSTYASAALAMSQLASGTQVDVENHKMTMLVDIGAGRTDLCILRGEHMLFNRSIPIGGNELTRRYETETGLTFEDAEERKLTSATLVGETPATEQTVEPAALLAEKEWADELILQLNRSIRAATRNLLDKDVKPDTLWLCGGSSQIPGLGQYISERLDISITDWNPLRAIPNIQLSSGVADEISEMSIRFAVALGLGVNAFDKRIDLSLVLPEIVRKKEQSERRRKTIRYAVAAAALVITIIAGITGWGQYRQGKLESVVEQLNQYKEEKTEAISSLRKDLVMMDMLGDRVSVLDVLKKLTEQLPKRTKVALTTFKVERLDDFNRARLTVNAEASSYENISQLISRIGNSEIFTSIRPGQIMSTERERKPVYSVQIKCELASNAVKLIAEAKERAMMQPSEELAVRKATEDIGSSATSEETNRSMGNIESDRPSSLPASGKPGDRRREVDQQRADRREAEFERRERMAEQEVDRREVELEKLEMMRDDKEVLDDEMQEREELLRDERIERREEEIDRREEMEMRNSVEETDER